MLRVTYWVTPSSAMRLASPPLVPPPTPSATIARSATRWLPAMSVGVGEAGVLDRDLLAQGADEEVVLVVLADLPGWVRP